MATLNAALRWLFDLALAPFASWPPIVPVTLASLAASVLMLLIFKRTSNQTQMAAVKRRIHAGLFEIRLFNDDLRAILRAQIEILRANGRYLGLSLVPMLFILPPLALIMGQLEYHYGYQGLRPGQRFLIECEVAPDASHRDRPQAALDLPQGLRTEVGPAWFPSQSRLAWRLVSDRDGAYEVGISVDGATRVTKSVAVTNRAVRLSPLRVAPGFVDELLYPAELPIPATSPVRAIRLPYPARDVSVLGHGMNWMIPFFGLSIVFAFALKGLFKVTL
jgi:hypothetical protein